MAKKKLPTLPPQQFRLAQSSQTQKQSPPAKIVSGKGETARGGPQTVKPASPPLDAASQDSMGRDPFSSQSQEAFLNTPQGELPQLSPLSSSPDSGLEYLDSPALSTDRHMAQLAELALSQNSTTTQAQAPMQMTTYTGDAVLLAKFSALLQEELSKACAIITTDLKDDFSNHW